MKKRLSYLLLFLLTLAILLTSCTVVPERDDDDDDDDDKTGSHEHVAGEAVKENETPADCYEAKWYHLVTYCKKCDEEMNRKKVTVGKPLGHKPLEPVMENFVEATETKSGSYDLVTYCKTCDDVIEKIRVITPPIIQAHSHSLSSEWSYDYSLHWNACVGCSEKFNIGTHTLVSNATGAGYCSVCGYECDHSDSTVDIQYDAQYHWLSEKCNSCDYKTVLGAVEAHSYNFNDGFCKCGRYKNEPDHDEHTYEEEWTRLDSVYHWKAPTCVSANGVECKTVPDYIEDAEREEHVNLEGDDDLCDICGGSVVNFYDIEAKYSQYNWPTTELIVCLNENSNNQELSSELRRYLAGDLGKNADGSAILPLENVDKLVAARNAAALAATNVTVKYVYWGEGDTEVENYGWGRTVDRILESSASVADDAPDIFVNQLYDMAAAQLKGVFINIRSQSYGGVNHFSFTDPKFELYVENTGHEFGYMLDFMNGLSFSSSKQYLIASDYFIDLVRAFFVMPVNISLLEDIGLESAWAGDNGADRDADGDFDADDFYAMVMNGEWTYEVLMHYSQKVHQPISNTEDGSIDDINGIIFAAENRMIASALLYSTSIKIFDRSLDENTGLYNCSYLENNEELFLFCDMLTAMVSAKGVVVDSVSHLVVRDKFVTDKVLFGGIITLGSLEYNDYQNMKRNDGFGVLPIPLYQRYSAIYDKNGSPLTDIAGNVINKQNTYITAIHNMGRIGAISAKAASKFAQCTAFLDYQSTHSSDILYEYYKYKLQYDATGGSLGNIQVLQYIRNHVRSSFDKTYEEIIDFSIPKTSPEYYRDSFVGKISYNELKYHGARADYYAITMYRKMHLDEILKSYEQLI